MAGRQTSGSRARRLRAGRSVVVGLVVEIGKSGYGDA